MPFAVLPATLGLVAVAHRRPHIGDLRFHHGQFGLDARVVRGLGIGTLGREVRFRQPASRDSCSRFTIVVGSVDRFSD